MSKNVFKLNDELISQIAAGEVIERPASVVKELVDNAIDAGSDEIKVRIQDGGLKLIEVSDNGKGISKEDLFEIFEPHTTSKIKSLEDLNNVMTMGFRGEALSTIKAIAKVVIASKEESSEFAYSIDFAKGETPFKAPRGNGTTISISNLFYNTPARLKFMKSNETEYRKILDVMSKFIMVHPSIHFILQNENKVVLNVPKASNLKERIESIIKKDYSKRMFSVHSKGSDIEIDGYISHPSDTLERTSDQFIFVNKRAISDKAITKAVIQGFSRYIPRQNRPPFVLSININPNQIDVNVHPRKEEIKFMNPFRVFSMIEQAVNQSLEQNLKLTTPIVGSDNKSNTTADSLAFDRAEIRYSQHSGNISEIRFDKKPTDFNIKKSIKFSQEALLPFDIKQPEFKNIFQIFNKYIVIEFEKDLWIVDQHAAAERINFERLLEGYKLNKPDIQNLLVCEEIECSEVQLSYVRENLDFFSKVGFNIDINEHSISVISIPSALIGYDLKEILSEIWNMPDDEKDLKLKSDRAIESILATIACHCSIRSGQKLSNLECESVFTQLKQCKNPYSCPHGRPAVWKQSLGQIDSNFLRTY